MEYDGSCYHGSQYQNNAPSVQAELEAAVNNLTGESVRVAFAGRTDAGVHALGQVAAFSTGARHRPETFLRALNRWLPPDIAVRRVLEVPPDFSPRRWAESRTYLYLVYDGPVRSPLLVQRAWQVSEPLDEGAMSAAAGALVGRHDFAAFAGRTPGSTVRTVRRVEVRRRGPLVCLEMEADAFLPHQVRRTAGALVQVGRGRLSVGDFGGLLRRAESASAGPAAPPWGLYLVRVGYVGLDLSPEADALAGLRPEEEQPW